MLRALITVLCIIFAQSASAIGVDERHTCGQGAAEPAVGQAFIDAIDCFGTSDGGAVPQPASLIQSAQQTPATAEPAVQSIPLPLQITMLTLSLIGLLVYRSLPAA